MFRTQLGAGAVIIEGLLSTGLSTDGESIAVLGMMSGILSIGLGLLMAYKSARA